MSGRLVRLVLEHSEAKGVARTLGAAVGEAMEHDDDWAWPDLVTWALRCNCDVSAVKRALNELEHECKELERESGGGRAPGGGGRSNRVRLRVQALAAKKSATVKRAEQRRAAGREVTSASCACCREVTSASGEVTGANSRSNRRKLRPEPSLEPSLEPEGGSRRSRRRRRRQSTPPPRWLHQPMTTWPPSRRGCASSTTPTTP